MWGQPWASLGIVYVYCLGPILIIAVGEWSEKLKKRTKRDCKYFFVQFLFVLICILMWVGMFAISGISSDSSEHWMWR